MQQKKEYIEELKEILAFYPMKLSCKLQIFGKSFLIADFSVFKVSHMWRKDVSCRGLL